MAIDTRQKRRSAMRARLPWKRTNAHIPVGSFNGASRQQRLGMYSGISWISTVDVKVIEGRSIITHTVQDDSIIKQVASGRSIITQTVTGISEIT